MFTISRNDAVRIRFALHSAALAMTSREEAQTPGSRIANEIHEVNSILSRFIAMIESTVEGTEFEIIPKASPRAKHSQAAANRLPGLGGASYAGEQRASQASGLQQIEGGMGTQDRQTVSTQEQDEERQT